MWMLPEPVETVKLDASVDGEVAFEGGLGGERREGCRHGPGLLLLSEKCFIVFLDSKDSDQIQESGIRGQVLAAQPIWRGPSESHADGWSAFLLPNAANLAQTSMNSMSNSDACLQLTAHPVSASEHAVRGEQRGANRPSSAGTVISVRASLLLLQDDLVAFFQAADDLGDGAVGQADLDRNLAHAFFLALVGNSTKAFFWLS